MPLSVGPSSPHLKFAMMESTISSLKGSSTILAATPASRSSCASWVYARAYRIWGIWERRGGQGAGGAGEHGVVA